MSRIEGTLERLNAGLVTAFELSGRGLVSSTRLKDEYAIRMCVMNHTSGPRDVSETLDWFATAPRPALPVTPGRGRPEDRHPDVRGGWADAGDFDPADGPGAVDLRRVGWRHARTGRTRGAGSSGSPRANTVIHRWHGTRHFYAIVAGTVEIRGLDGPVPELGPGEFFGELAALDWGAGFGYARTADVVARSAARLLVLNPASLSELLRLAPSLDATLRATARARVTRL